jgi:hypothetical protein
MADAQQANNISGQQLQALQKAADERMRRVLSDIDLRKWAVSEAAKVAPGDVVTHARAIHAFLTEGATTVPPAAEPQ